MISIMRYIKYITALFAFFAVVASCIDEDVVRLSGGNGNCIQLVGRVMPFTDVEVDTRSPKNDPKEYAANTMDLMIFGRDNKCVFAAHQGSGEDVFTIDRGNDDNDGSFENIDQDILDSCRVYAVANIPEVYSAATKEGKEFKEYWKGKTFDKFDSITTQVNGIGIPQAGMPMVGMLPETLDLSKESEIEGNTPYQIPMKALYAKMVFTIDVVADQNNTGITPNFEISDFTVHNLVKYIPLDFDLNGRSESPEGDTIGANDKTPIHMKSETEARSFVGAVTGTNIAYDRYGQISFSFYLPERYLQAKEPANKYQYPFRGVNGSLREEDKGLRQRYKPKLAQETATYMTMSGVFTNHQGHTYDVDYDIYVGADNYSNFDVVRNHQYNNYITIKGIQNSSDQSNDSVAVSIDHRVNVNRTLPIIVNLRRETLLDAHFEVRPMRIRKNPNHRGDIAPTHVKVEVLYGNEESYPDGKGNWISLERSFGSGSSDTTNPYINLYCTEGSSAGKRKYFTYDLVNSSFSKNDGTGDLLPLHSSTSVVVPISKDNECVWIYVDECTEHSTDIKAVRSAKIKITYGKGDNLNSFAPISGIEPLVYIINQHKLFQVTWEGRSYLIEHEEEYLHNFDSDDTYGSNKTEFEGMEWGLDGIQLSNNHPAVHVTSTPSSWLGTILEAFGAENVETLCKNALGEADWDPKYDFYLSRDNVKNVVIRDFEGINFNQDIKSYIVKKYQEDYNKDGSKVKIEQIRLDEIPESAFAYCYNRNKRNNEGYVVSQTWYLPAIDEMEYIMYGGHNSFEEFHSQYYWSCQSAYIKNEILFEFWNATSFVGSYKRGDDIKGAFYIDDTHRARATMAEYAEGSFKDVKSSGADISGTQHGKMYVRTSILNPESEFQKGDYVPNGEFDSNYTDYPGNRARDSKARVRAVYYKQ